MQPHLAFKYKLLDFQGLRSGIFDCDCACASAPNYDSTAAATKESAQIMADLGNRQLEETKRQYDNNMAVAKPVVDAQLAIMQQTQDQGTDYYDYLKSTYRPLEQKMVAEADAAGSQALQDEKAGQAIADTRAGSTAATNAMIRQGIRYGMSPDAISSRMGSASVDLASKETAAANTARTAEEAKGWAKKLDAAGLGRNLPGASQGAYSLATTAGNSAVGNQNATSGQYLNGLSTAAGISGQGAQMNLQGNLGILNSQTSYANATNQSMSQGGDMGGLGSLLGGAAKLYTASSKELKTNKNPISESVALIGLEKIPVEQWDYKKGVADEGTHIGPYAQDVQKEFGDQVAPGGQMIDLVSMNGITIAAVKGLAKKVAGLEKIIAKQDSGNVIDGEFDRVVDKAGPAVLPHVGLVRMEA